MAERITYKSTLRLGDMEALIGQVAASRLPGIIATTICIEATAEGKQLLSRLSEHPLTKAASLLAEAAEDRRIARQAPTYSRDHRLDGVLNPEDPDRFSRLFGSPASRKERRAGRLLNAEGYPWTPNSDLPSPRVLIEEAADRLLYPPVPVAPGH